MQTCHRLQTTTLTELIKQRFSTQNTLPEDLDLKPAQINELFNILNHRSQRRFTDKTIETELLQLLFACALSAPSKSDLQQADIIHIADPAKRQAIQTLIPNMPWIGEAPVFLVFCGNNRRIRLLCEKHNLPFANDHLDSFMNAAVDAGIVLMNFIRAAEAVGLACCPISVIRNHAAKISELLQLPHWVFPVAGLCVGYPVNEGQISPRLPLTVTVHTDSYQEENWQQQIDTYDRYRDSVQPIEKTKQRHQEHYGIADFYGWSADKARQYSVAERADFGAYIRGQGFDLS